MYIELEDVKRHLIIEDNADDLYLLTLIDAAIADVEYHIDDKLSNLEDCNGNLPSGLIHAIMLLIGTWYNNRESVSYGNAHAIPQTFDYLIQHYINYEGRRD